MCLTTSHWHTTSVCKQGRVTISYKEIVMCVDTVAANGFCSLTKWPPKLLHTSLFLLCNTQIAYKGNTTNLRMLLSKRFTNDTKMMEEYTYKKLIMSSSMRSDYWRFFGREAESFVVFVSFVSRFCQTRCSPSPNHLIVDIAAGYSP